MGAVPFIDYGAGSDLAAAFAEAVEDAQHEFGHGPYTGTIAGKEETVTISDSPLTWKAAQELAEELIEDRDGPTSDKYGPAGAIRVVDTDRDGWLLFGWAPS